MTDITFYIIALLAVIATGFLLRHILGCLQRIILVVTVALGLSLIYYFFVGQYDPEMRHEVEKNIQKYDPDFKPHKDKQL